MEQKKVYRGNDTLFYNSQCVFVEYHDVIAMPWFTMLSIIKETTAFRNIFNMDEIINYDIDGLLEWYIYRKYRNVFKSIGTIDTIETLPDEGYDNLLQKAMDISPDLYHIPTNLRFLSILRLLLSDTTMVKQVIIYSENNEPMIEESLKQYFSRAGSKVKYMYGKFEDMLSLIPNDSTYVLSDISKVNTMIDKKKLNMSCILVPNGLRYNYMEDDINKIKVDLKELTKTYIFKYSFFDNFDMTDILGDNPLPSELENMPKDTQ